MKTNQLLLKAGLLPILLTVFLLISIKSDAQNKSNAESPYFFVKSTNSNTEQMPLKSTKVEVDILGVIAHVHVQQVYKNEGNETIEAIYVFPGSTNAAVHDMRMQVGERVLQAQIFEKNAARKKYEKAKSQGKTASLLEQHRPNVFQMNVANIMPKDLIKVDLYYTELLVPESGIYEFVYPTVVGPRYSNADSTAQNNNSYVSNPYTHQNEKPLYTFDIEVNLNAGMPLNNVKCGTHETNITFINETKSVCKLKETNKFEGNRDFVLNYKLTGNKINSGLLMFEGEEENFFLLMLQPPSIDKTEETPAKEYIFIVDVSGSMHGFPLNISKELITNLLSNLNANDKFNIILFAGTSNIMSDSSLQATPKNIGDAIKMIDNQQGSGGTQLSLALKKGLALKNSENFSRTFVIITDGYIGQESETFELINNNPTQANFFTFGIGSSVNRHLIEGIARIGLGEPFVVLKRGEAKEKANKFKEYIENPVLTNIKVEFNNFESYDIIPKSYPDVFAQRPIIIYGKWKGSLNGNIKISGITGSTSYNKVFNVQQADKSNSYSALKYLWARKKIQNLNDFAAYSHNSETKTKITELGIKYNLLTKYTSFVAIDSVKRETGSSKTVKQPLPLPKGVENSAVGIISTASNIEVDEIEADYDIVFEVDEAEEECEVLIFSYVERMPEFAGGVNSLRAYIAKNIKYPEIARENEIQGTVYVRFVVKKNGEIGEVQIVKGVDPLLDNEAIRVIKSLPKFKPGMQDGIRVEVWYSIPIKFVLKE